MGTFQDSKERKELAELMIQAAKELDIAAERIKELEAQVDNNAIAFADFLLKANASNNGFGGWHVNVSLFSDNSYGTSSKHIYHKIFKKQQ